MILKSSGLQRCCRYWVSPAGSWLCRMNGASVILQEYTSIIGANSFKGVEKIAAGMYW